MPASGKPPMNVIEKILYHHAVGWKKDHVAVGDVICVNADWSIASELTWKGMDKLYTAIGRPKIHRPDRFWLAIDHTVDPRNVHEPKPKALIKLASDFAEEAGLTDFWGPNQTIMHTEFARQRAQPGQIVIGADSHTCSGGGMGAFAVGLGAGDVVMPLVTGQTWFRVPEVVYIELVGEPKFGIGGKDIILHILGELKRNTVALERAVLYGGEGLKYLSDDARFAIANMSTEFGAIAGVFVADEITARVLKNRPNHNEEGLYFRSDPGCNYAAHHIIDLSKVVSQIAVYPSPDNCVPVTEKLGMKLDGCFIGACTTTQEDLILGAMVLQAGLNQGLTPVNNGIRRVTPGSLIIIDKLEKLGLLDIYRKAGFTVGQPGCSYCVGIAADVAGEGEVWLSSQNRNFRNRMGKGAIGNLASASCVAASSFNMEVTDPEPLIAAIDQGLFDSYRGWVGDSEPVPFTISEPQPIRGEESSDTRSVYEFIASLPSKLTGRVQRFEDNIDTDAVIPAQFMGLDPTSPLWLPHCKNEEEFLAEKSFAYVRPEFVSRVRAGQDIIVAGKAFGSGSSREEAARCLKAVGVKAVIAKSFAYIYARNQPNNALLGITITDEDFYEHAVEGAEVTVDVENRVVKVSGLDKVFPFSLTDMEENFLQGGGIQSLYSRYKKDLFVAAMKGKAVRPISSGDNCGTVDSGCGQSNIEW